MLDIKKLILGERAHAAIQKISTIPPFRQDLFLALARTRPFSRIEHGTLPGFCHRAGQRDIRADRRKGETRCRDYCPHPGQRGFIPVKTSCRYRPGLPFRPTGLPKTHWPSCRSSDRQHGMVPPIPRFPCRHGRPGYSSHPPPVGGRLPVGQGTGCRPSGWPV